MFLSNPLFWTATLERAVKTFAQTAVGILTAQTIGLFDADWTGVLSAAGMATVISVLTSIGSGGVGSDSPSLAGEELSTRGRHAAD